MLALVINAVLLLAPLPSHIYILALVLINGAIVVLWRNLSLHRTSVHAIEFYDEQWRVLVNETWRPVKLVNYALFRDKVIMLHLISGWRFWRVYFWSDSADASALRKLRMRLLHGIS